MKRAQALAVLLLLTAACPQPAPADNVLASPDQKHALFYSSQGKVRIIDAATGQETGRVEHIAFAQGGTFSLDGSVLLAYDFDAQHLVSLRLSDAKVTDLGLSYDQGLISADGKWVVSLQSGTSCIQGTHTTNCVDIWAIPSGGGTAVKIGSGLTAYLFDPRYGVSGLGMRDFAGNDHVIFIDNEGSLWSTPVDGSGPPFLVAPKIGDDQYGVPFQPYAFAPRGVPKFLFTDAAGTHLAEADGKSSTLIAPDAVSPACNPYDLSQGLPCRASPDGKTLLVAETGLDFVLNGGQVTVSTTTLPPVYRLGVLSLDDPAGPKIVAQSPGSVILSDGDGGFVFYRSEGTLVKHKPDGTEAAIFPTLEPDSQVFLGPQSPDNRWVELFPSSGFGSDCINCTVARFLSLADGSTWVPSDEQGAIPVWFFSWSPDGSKVLIDGQRRRFSPTESGGALYVANASGSDLRLIDDDVDSATWVDSHHIAVSRMYGHGDHPGGTFIDQVP